MIMLYQFQFISDEIDPSHWIVQGACSYSILLYLEFDIHTTTVDIRNNCIRYPPQFL